MHRTLIILALATFGVAGTALAQQVPSAPGVAPHNNVGVSAVGAPELRHSMPSVANNPRPSGGAGANGGMAFLPDNHAGVESSYRAANAAVLHSCVAQPHNSDMLAHCSSANDFRTLDLCMKAYLYQVGQCVQASSGRVSGRPVAILPGVPTPRADVGAPQDMMWISPAPPTAETAR